ncbi:MAG: hypothetical protein NZM35_01665 [Chitinophagales bacterium]|nr:hypothetical protein [Chitinophagales bacterium]MDW8418211.1 hypothetical protein [Chitinophagales bacterium]
MAKKNKPIAGYHMLMILSAADGNFNGKEDKVIEKWIEHEMPLPVNLDREMEEISALKPEDYMLHFKRCMADFYEDSTEEERNRFLEYAIRLTKADRSISREENIYLDELFNEWTETQL